MTDSDLLKQYTPLVVRIVGSFQRRLPCNVLREDLIAAGMVGLWDAIKKNGAEPITKRFEWYASVRVRGSIIDELRAQDWLPRRARAKIEAEKDAFGEASFAMVRFDDIRDGDYQRAVLELETDEEAMTDRLMQELMLEAVERLPVRERYVVAQHYFSGVKFKDLSVEMGVSEPRISQLHSRAMERLKEMAVAI